MESMPIDVVIFKLAFIQQDYEIKAEEAEDFKLGSLYLGRAYAVRDAIEYLSQYEDLMGS